jgi:hypothetical protein
LLNTYATRNDGIILRPVKDKSFEIFADTDFVRNWHQRTEPDDPSTTKSHSGYMINYAGCPIAWASKLQMIVALSSTEAEYVSLSEALQDMITLMDLINEFKDYGFKVYSEVLPRVHCKSFEDNSGVLELTRLPKLRPCMEHINIKYHHFHEHV